MIPQFSGVTGIAVPPWEGLPERLIRTAYPTFS
jgi:hypothetical protein